MNFFENEIAKYKRRIEAIKQHPSSLMLSSNRIFYEAMLRENELLLQAWQEGKIFLGASGPRMLMRCFGDFHMLNLVRIADRLSAGVAESSIDRVRALGLPEYACDRTILFLPLVFMQQDLPKPHFIVSRTGNCEVINDTHRTLARLLNVPMYTIDIPFQDPVQEYLSYVLAQLKEFIEFFESSLPEAKYKEGKLVSLQEYGRRFHAALCDIYQLRQHVPCPDHPRDVFREPINPEEFTEPSLIVQYYESYRDELQQRIEKGWTPVGDEKLRIVWAVTGPYGSNVWDYLAKRGVSVPFWHFGAAQMQFIRQSYGDMLEFGRKLSPLEEEARMMLYNSWGGDGKRWIADTIRVCKEFHADGLVVFEQTGCQPVLGLGEMTAKRVESELEIPVWRVEGRQLLGRSERTNAEFMAGLEAFINLCMDRK